MSQVDVGHALLDCLERRDAAGAIGVVLPLAHGGAAVEEAIDVLARAQREVGVRWQRNEWTIAQEHAATAIIDRALAAAAGTLSEPAIHGTVIVTCAEGEWHTLAPRMLTDVLRARRWDARFLGGSMPPTHLRVHLEGEQPLALALSCSIPISLPGAYASISAAHTAGVPVIAGGQAFGSNGSRAAALGADAWAADGPGIDDVLHAWADGKRPVPPQREATAAPAHAHLRHGRAAIVERAEAELTERLPYLRSADRHQRDRTREDLEFLAAFLEAAVLVHDHTILEDYLRWLAEVLETRGVPLLVLPPTVHAMTVALNDMGHEGAAEMLASVADPFLASLTGS